MPLVGALWENSQLLTQAKEKRKTILDIVEKRMLI